jgi:hypothetical protein
VLRKIVFLITVLSFLILLSSCRIIDKPNLDKTYKTEEEKSSNATKQNKTSEINQTTGDIEKTSIKKTEGTKRTEETSNSENYLFSELRENHIFTGKYVNSIKGIPFLKTGLKAEDLIGATIQNNLINVNNIWKRNDFKTKAKSLFVKYEEKQYVDSRDNGSDAGEEYVFQRIIISMDGSRYITFDSNVNIVSKYSLFNSKNNKLIKKLDMDKFKDGKYKIICFDNVLSQAIMINYSNDSKYYIFSLNNDTMKEINIGVYGYPYKLIFSPDNKNLCYNIEFDGKDYILIYNIEKDKYIKCIKFTEELRLNHLQWTINDELIYTSFDSQRKPSSFIFDLKTDEIKLLGHYMLNPMMSNDGKYLAYYYATTYDSVELYMFSEYNADYYDTGLYIKNLENDEIIELPSVYPYFEDEGIIYYEYIQKPLQWFYMSSDIEINNSIYIDDYKNPEFDTYLYLESFSSLYEYPIENIMDNNINTCWAEEQKDRSYSSYDNDESGIGEYIFITTVRKTKEKGFTYEEEKLLKGIKIINGYSKSESTYMNNNRVKEIEIELSDKQRMTFVLEDNNMDFQTLLFPEPIKTTHVKIFIRDIYKGTKYNDTCISEIELIE